MSERLLRLRLACEIAALAIFMVVCLAVLYKVIFEDQSRGGSEEVIAAERVPPTRDPRPEPRLPSQPVSFEEATSKGSASAKIGLMAWSEFQCPWCQRFVATTFADLNRDYIASGRVLFIFRHLPLEQIHPLAMGAAQAVECAGRQGKFWPMHDLMFLNPKLLAAQHLQKHASRLRLETTAFAACVEGSEAEAKVRHDLAEAEALGVTGTPTFFFGLIDSGNRLKVTHRMSGSKPLGEFKRVLDPLIAMVNKPNP
jgi:predicted DsbA family dithiol-disulfide isomerase